MKVINEIRSNVYPLVSCALHTLNQNPVIVELGVLRGDNALSLYNAFNPVRFFLVDSWSPFNKNIMHPFEKTPYYINEPDFYSYYYGGPLDQQSTFDAIYDECCQKFNKLSNVEFIKSDSISAIDYYAEWCTSNNINSKKSIDVLYIDAAHEYQYVLRDLMYWQDLVCDEGVILLNDCCFSKNGCKQNLGVLEAVTHFVKRSDFYPVLLTNTDWSDVVLVKKGSKISDLISQEVLRSSIRYVEVPHQLLGSMHVVYGKTNNISFV